MSINNDEGKDRAVNNCSTYYCISMLKLLRSMDLISDDEFKAIVNSTIEYYDSDIIA